MYNHTNATNTPLRPDLLCRSVNATFSVPVQIVIDDEVRRFCHSAEDLSISLNKTGKLFSNKDDYHNAKPVIELNAMFNFLGHGLESECDEQVYKNYTNDKSKIPPLNKVNNSTTSPPRSSQTFANPWPG